MDDRTLLNMAAKAIGQVYVDGESWDECAGWNPLEDDGDALRLAVRLRLHIEWRVDGRVAVSPRDYVADIYITESTREDRYAATRRAVVRAAAEIGRAIP